MSIFEFDSEEQMDRMFNKSMEVNQDYNELIRKKEELEFRLSFCEDSDDTEYDEEELEEIKEKIDDLENNYGDMIIKQPC